MVTVHHGPGGFSAAVLGAPHHRSASTVAHHGWSLQRERAHGTPRGDILHQPKRQETAVALGQQMRDSEVCPDPMALSIGHQLHAAMVVGPIAGCRVQLLDSRPVPVAAAGVGIPLEQPGERPTLQSEHPRLVVDVRSGVSRRFDWHAALCRPVRNKLRCWLKAWPENFGGRTRRPADPWGHEARARRVP